MLAYAHLDTGDEWTQLTPIDQDGPQLTGSRMTTPTG